MSFRHVGDAKHDRFVTKCANYVNAARIRHLVAYQKRNLSDILFPFIVEPLLHRSGDFWFTIACESTEEELVGKTKLDALIGEVCIFKSKKDWARFADADRLLSDINMLRRRRLFVNADEKCTTFRSNATQFSDIRVGFKLLRNGEIYVGQPQLNDTELESKSNDYSINTIGIFFARWIENQTYFFVRDLCHFHQHHSTAEDTIIILQELDAKRGWRNNIIYSLQHYIISQRRSSWVIDLHRAHGVLAYAKSFEGISCLAAPETPLEAFQFEAISKSIDARIKELDSTSHVLAQSRSWRIARLGSIRSAGLAALAILCSVIISAMQPYFQAHHYNLMQFGNMLVSKFPSIFSCFLVISVLFFISTDDRSYGKSRPHLGWFAMRKNALGFRDIATVAMFHPIFFGSAFLIICFLMLLFIALHPI